MTFDKKAASSIYALNYTHDVWKAQKNSGIGYSAADPGNILPTAVGHIRSAEGTQEVSPRQQGMEEEKKLGMTPPPPMAIAHVDVICQH